MEEKKARNTICAILINFYFNTLIKYILNIYLHIHKLSQRSLNFNKMRN